MYGLTENGPRVSFGWLPKPIPDRSLPWPVGKAVSGTRVRVRKQCGAEAEVQEVGEIEVSGKA